VMSQFGLVHKLRIMTEAVEQAGQLKVHFHHHGLDERLPEALEKQVLTILEELITNALKHAEGQNLEIQLVRNGIYLTISVEDDGKGFDMASLGKQTKAGLGLKSLEQIIKQLGGQLSIESQPGMGSSTFIEIPL
jgi:signal transduction histidine kinase